MIRYIYDRFINISDLSSTDARDLAEFYHIKIINVNKPGFCGYTYLKLKAKPEQMERFDQKLRDKKVTFHSEERDGARKN